MYSKIALTRRIFQLKMHQITPEPAAWLEHRVVYPVSAYSSALAGIPCVYSPRDGQAELAKRVNRPLTVTVGVVTAWVTGTLCCLRNFSIVNLYSPYNGSIIVKAKV